MREEQPAPLILTLMFDPASEEFFQRLRQTYFPPSLNIVPAHVTIFHHLPGAELEAIEAAVRDACLRQRCSPFEVAGVRNLGHGTALALRAPGMAGFRPFLERRFQDWLTPQDRQAWRPHVTVQNKVSAAEARRVTAALEGSRYEGSVIGVRLWLYLGGQWELRFSAPFGGDSPDQGGSSCSEVK